MGKFTSAQLAYLETAIEMDGNDRIKRVYGTVYGNLVGNVWGNVIGSIKGHVAGRIEGSVLGTYKVDDDVTPTS